MKHSELRHQPRHVNPRIQDLWMFIIVLLWPKKHKTEKGLLRCAIFSFYRLKIDITYATNRNCVLEFGVKQ